MNILNSIVSLFKPASTDEVGQVVGGEVTFDVTGDARRNLTRALRLLQCRDSLDTEGLNELSARLAHAKKNGVDVSSSATVKEALDGCI